jgi:hypothetical protein
MLDPLAEQRENRQGALEDLGVGSDQTARVPAAAPLMPPLTGQSA